LLSRLAALKASTWIVAGVVVVGAGGAGIALAVTHTPHPRATAGQTTTAISALPSTATLPPHSTTTATSAPAVTSTHASQPDAISWLAAGDSYASGAGLTRTTEPCADGVGTTAAPSKAWAIVASESPLLAGKHYAAPDLVACTGAETGEFFALQGGDPAEWTPSMGRYDLVTFSFGGDNINFASIVTACLDRTGECTDPVVRGRIAALGATYSGFLTRVATSAVVAGGNVVVMGYPEVVEVPNLWPQAVQDAHICQGFITNDANLMRGWAGDLNATIGIAVTQANALPADQRNDVHFTFIDVVSGQANTGIGASDPNLFEPATGTRHELCSDGDNAWLNGLSPLHPDTRSYHPNQAGEDAMGNLAAEVISRLSWPWSPARWHLLGAIPGANPGPPLLNAPTCPSTNFCMVAGVKQAFTWNGRTWSSAAAPPAELSGLSCGSATFCMGVYSTAVPESAPPGSTSEAHYTSYAVGWDGSSWSTPTVLNSYTAMEGYGVVHNVSCTSPSFCVAVGANFGSAIWNGISWRFVPGHTTGTDGGGFVTCATPTFCMDAPADPNTIVFDGSSWGHTASVGPSAGLGASSLSCGSPTFCAAGFSEPNQLPAIWNGNSWRSTGAGESNYVSDVACSGDSFCVMTQINGDVATWNGSAWSPPFPLVGSDQDATAQVVCASSSYCMLTYLSDAYLFAPGNQGVTAPPYS
jgi:hypothetical protein